MTDKTNMARREREEDAWEAYDNAAYVVWKEEHEKSCCSYRHPREERECIASRLSVTRADHIAKLAQIAADFGDSESHRQLDAVR